MNILTTEDARFIDREVPKQLGVSLEILMENAGRGIVDALWGQYDLFSLDNARSINSFVPLNGEPLQDHLPHYSLYRR